MGGLTCDYRSASLCLPSKRDLLQCQKRPTTVSKETYYSGKRDLLQWQKRPTTVSKETYYSGLLAIIAPPVFASPRRFGLQCVGVCVCVCVCDDDERGGWGLGCSV